MNPLAPYKIRALLCRIFLQYVQRGILKGVMKCVTLLLINQQMFPPLRFTCTLMCNILMTFEVPYMHICRYITLWQSVRTFPTLWICTSEYWRSAGSMVVAHMRQLSQRSQVRIQKLICCARHKVPILYTRFSVPYSVLVCVLETVGYYTSMILCLIECKFSSMLLSYLSKIEYTRVC